MFSESINLLDLSQDISNHDYWHQGRMILIKKEMDWTSFDLVNKCKISLKYGIGLKKIKLGHAGTLDPKASGLMLLLAGKYTKLTDQIHLYNKTYEGSFYLGATTPCYDTERPIDHYFPTEHINELLILNAASQFVGEISQTPPIFSAVKINGKSAYKSAHKGKEIATRPRQITIHSFEITRLDLPFVYFKVICSSGTYIRSLAHDFGKALKSGAYLASLNRTGIGPWNLHQAVSVQQFLEKVNQYRIITKPNMAV